MFRLLFFSRSIKFLNNHSLFIFKYELWFHYNYNYLNNFLLNLNLYLVASPLAYGRRNHRCIPEITLESTEYRSYKTIHFIISHEIEHKVPERSRVSISHSIVCDYLYEKFIQLTRNRSDVTSYYRKIRQIIDTFGSNLHIELQQRGIEFSQLFRKYDHLRPALLERMPPMETARPQANGIIGMMNGEPEPEDEKSTILEPVTTTSDSVRIYTFYNFSFI